MSLEQRSADYARKAKEAEGQALKAKDEASKAAWLRIAAGYHDLLSNLERHPPAILEN